MFLAQKTDLMRLFSESIAQKTGKVKSTAWNIEQTGRTIKENAISF